MALSCPDCAQPVTAEDRFCENCGLSLMRRRTAEGGPLRTPRGSCASCGGTVDAEGFCEQCGRAQPAPRDLMEFDLGFAAGVSDRGQVRVRNEDSLGCAILGPRDAPTAVVVIVCDGVGSTERADQASQTAVDAALARIVDCLEAGKDPYESTVDGSAAAFEAVRLLAEPGSPDLAPSCTLVSAVATDEGITVGWIGDSRAYWLSADGSRQLTVDDTLHAQLVAAGMTVEEASAEANAHALARWVGADAEPVLPQVAGVPAGERGTLIVCSDGLWNYLPAAETIAAQAKGSPAEMAAKLTAAANELGGGDNITVVAVPYPFDRQGTP
ncbi:PP2C family serine/threonine-protein phosphatase [Amycolatopsis sp. GM8]|uniref:PP2C family serine/threonine-protein phosphatase n=1 Tax=Amycolatopsis sp. GM8 TaxID=2896530 RepID=UPI001F46129D|nr:PP2C family serine/threonine-protein phosphatase [Amycolatopsis sp. GM8]